METLLGTDHHQTAIAVADATAIAAVRRYAGDLAVRRGFDETRAGQVAIVATEVASNIFKHAARGHVLIRALARDGVAGIELIAIDAGPGMGNLAASMVDGTSTTGTYGAGLGAMKRLSQEFDIFTAPGKGTVIGLCLWQGGVAPAEGNLQLGTVCQPIAGETACGDAWSVAFAPASARVLLADGLGHGPQAAAASDRAAAVLQTHAGYPVTTIIEECDIALRGSRGAAMAVAAIDTARSELSYAGVGNIAAHVYDAGGANRRQMVSHNGIVGSNVRKVQAFATSWPAGALLIMHSDGLGSRWDLGDYPGAFHCHPRVIAGLLYRDFARGRDDACVLVLRDHQWDHA
jgi:anti-sigma regulatory factor (Ser/Thr protein kinase)